MPKITWDIWDKEKHFVEHGRENMFEITKRVLMILEEGFLKFYFSKI